jgi:hypothetical protein
MEMVRAAGMAGMDVRTEYELEQVLPPPLPRSRPDAPKSDAWDGVHPVAGKEAGARVQAWAALPPDRLADWTPHQPAVQAVADASLLAAAPQGDVEGASPAACREPKHLGHRRRARRGPENLLRPSLEAPQRAHDVSASDARESPQEKRQESVPQPPKPQRRLSPPPGRADRAFPEHAPRWARTSGQPAMQPAQRPPGARWAWAEPPSCARSP